MDIAVINWRPYQSKGTVGFFDIAIDSTFVVRGFALKVKNDGSGYYWQSPSKKRMKGGQPVKDANGYDVYDAHFDLYGEKNGEGKYTPTKSAYDGRQSLIDLAVAAYKAAESGRGPAKPEAVATAVEGAGDGEDNDLPF